MPIIDRPPLLAEQALRPQQQHKQQQEKGIAVL